MDTLARITLQQGRSASAKPALERNEDRTRTIPRPLSSADATQIRPQKPVVGDYSLKLSTAGPSVVNSRNGSVLSRGFILKTDYYPSGRALDLELNLQGAPNFRSSSQSRLNVYGVAQPRLQGLKAILSVLRCRKNSNDSSHCIWISTREEPIIYISGRPFVLRDAARPKSTMSLSDRAENLEAVEDRLKSDILTEAAKYGGLILTHSEISEESAIIPTWTAVDSISVQTALEVWEGMAAEGWKIEYHRIPIGPERLIEDNYLDAYVHILNQPRASIVETTPLVFNCGMGVVRTTFAMIAASLVRRRQLVNRGLPDPFDVQVTSSGQTASVYPAHSIEQANQQLELSRSLLRLTSLLQQNLTGRESVSVTETLLAQPILLESLRKAHQGNYGIVLSLLGCLDRGLEVKRLVDKVIDSCDQVKHLREEILAQRVKYSLTKMEEARGEDLLSKAVKALEKYFFLIAFGSYVAEQVDFQESFSNWLKTRVEIWNQIMYLRKSSLRKVLAPVNDLSALSGHNMDRAIASSSLTKDIPIFGGHVLGDELTNHLVHNRGGIILRADTVLKSDQWIQDSQDSIHAIRGVINFRNIKGTSIYASGQPSIDAIDEIISRIRGAHPGTKTIIWITLREEPIVYINGSPYCLRRDGYTLRNMKDYGGISPSRLEVLEERLKADVISEIVTFGGKVLLHTEAGEDVFPVWEEAEPDAVLLLKDIMRFRKDREPEISLQYHRVPITAEQAPDFSDISELLDVVIKSDLINAPIVVNDQLGRGRSTMASIIVLLIRQWADRARNDTHSRISPQRQRSTSQGEFGPKIGIEFRQHSYQVINNVLRVVKDGLVVKAIVDDAIDRCAPFTFNLRDSIEDSRLRAEQATEIREKKKQISRGRHNLRRYFTLILFQAYLDSIVLDDRQNFEPFEGFLKANPVFETFEKELLGDDATTLKPLERVDVKDSSILPDEVKKVVLSRSGAVLASSTIIKSDYFSGLEKLSLVEKIEGSPNFRFVSLNSRTPPNQKLDTTSTTHASHGVCGTGMPTLEGLKRALSRLNAHPGGSSKVYWTSLREEPVVYVSGRPHVLRLVDRPLENVEATGVTTEMVETIERTLKSDLCREAFIGHGNLLLHDEEERRGSFDVVPVWQTVKEEDIMTPREVYEILRKEGFQVDYDRIAITDEQAPLPEALAKIFERVNHAFLEQGYVVFNCQMGRGRTTTGMVVAALVSWKAYGFVGVAESSDDEEVVAYDLMDGMSEEEALVRGEYKIILKIVGVLSYGRWAKRLADHAIDLMSNIQNLRKAIYDYKLKVNASDIASRKHQHLENVAFNYLYRYATLIVFANYLVEGEKKYFDFRAKPFPIWLKEHREITTILNNLTLE